MRWLRGDCGGFDSLDIAAVWPASASVAGMPLPELGSASLKCEQTRMKETKEML